MGIREMTEFLNKNEDLLFPGTTGTLPGLNEYTLRDFTVLLDILEQVEKETGKKVTVMISLFDFLLGDGIYRQGPYLKYFVGEYPQVVTDPLVRVKIQAITWELMKTLKQDPRFVKYVTMVELINEPANACVLSTKEYFNDLVNFAGTGLYLLKDALGPSMPVGIGFRSWPRDLKFWSGISDGIDILTVHYWESLESYDINTPGLWPLDMPVKELWDLLGTKADGRIVGMTEISLPPGFEGYLEQTQKAGYDLCLVWSYSGHDGFKAKDLFGEISKYQAANSKK